MLLTMEIDAAEAARNGGVVTRGDLLRWGNDDGAIRRAVATGAWLRLRRGWYALPGADERVTAAVRRGGVLSCTGALAWRGIWTLRTCSHVRSSHWQPSGSGRRPVWHGPAPRCAVDPLPVALLMATDCASAEELLVIVDSVLHLGLMRQDEVAALFAHAPRRVRDVLRRTDVAESGTETLVRSRLRAHGVRVRPQVVVPGVGRVDLLVGTSLVIEVDSREHHTNRLAYEADRTRDRRLRALGYTVVRLTYRQAVHDWPAVEADLLHMIRRRDHRRPTPLREAC